MLQLLTFAMFLAVGAISIYAIVITVRQEMPYILRALGIYPAPPPPLTQARIRLIQAIKHKV